MKYLHHINLTLLLLVWSTQMVVASEILKQGPFSGVDITRLDKNDAETIREANEDFMLVLNGKTPKYAKLNEEAPLPADGGTTYYIGKRYELVITKSLSTFGELHGYIYGPIVTFEKSFSSGNTNSVKYLRFYTTNQLKELEK